MTWHANIINCFECKGVILKTINDVINLHSRCVYHRLSLIIQFNNTKRNILDIKKDYHYVEAEEGKVFPSPEIAKGPMSVIAVTVIMENWDTLETLTEFRSHGAGGWSGLLSPALHPHLQGLTEPHSLWETLGNALPPGEIDVSKPNSRFMQKPWCKYILNCGLSPNYR